MSITRRFNELKGVSLADQAKEMIRGAILDGAIKPAERITIEQIAAELGISRTPVREALKALEGDGMVKLLPHRGAIVEPFAVEDIVHRYAIRAMLEGYAAELACKADAERLADELEANCETLTALAEMTDVSDPKQVRMLVEMNQKFHMAIRKASGSETLLRLMDSLRQPLSFALQYWQSKERQQQSIEIHKRIATAFRANDPKLARQLMEQHLLDARDRLVDSSGQPSIDLAPPRKTARQLFAEADAGKGSPRS